MWSMTGVVGQQNLPSAAERLRKQSGGSAKRCEKPAGGSAKPNPFDVTDLLRDGFFLQSFCKLLRRHPSLLEHIARPGALSRRLGSFSA